MKLILAKAIDWMKRNKAVLLLFVLLSFLRLYRLSDFVTFLGDQGRDAIIIKRIITLEHWPAIGAPTSVGQVYLGPFYYYFMAPWLLVFNFHPLGLAFGVAFMSVLAGIVIFFAIRKHFDKVTAFFFLLLLVFSAANISLSRFSWNPNFLPIFTFFTLWLFDLTLSRRQWGPALLFGAFFAFSLQLHYLAALIAPVFLIFLVREMIRQPKTRTPLLLKLVGSVFSFAVFSVPLLIFDLRHEFLNSRNFIKMFTEGGATKSGSFLTDLAATSQAFIENTWQVQLAPFLSLGLVLAIVLVALALKDKLKNRLFYLNLWSLVVYLLGFSFMNSGRYEHYFTPVYYSFFLVLAVVFAVRTRVCQVCRVIIAGLVILYIGLNAQKYTYLLKDGSRQIEAAMAVSRTILPEIKKEPFQMVALPYTETDGQYRYFLEIWGRTPLPENTLERPEELFVLCYQAECNVLNDPQWQIAAFENKKIAKIWTVKRMKIYKLVHGSK